MYRCIHLQAKYLCIGECRNAQKTLFLSGKDFYVHVFCCDLLGQKMALQSHTLCHRVPSEPRTENASEMLWQIK